MHIGLDTAPITQHRQRGVGALGAYLVEALLRGDSRHKFTLFRHAGPPPVEGIGGGGALVEMRERPAVRGGFSVAWLADQIRLDRQVRRARPDVFHAYFQWNLPLRRLPLPVVGHIYDLMPLADSHIYTERYGLRVGWKLRLYERYLRAAIGRLDRAIVISAHSGKDLARLMGFPEDRIHVVYPAPAPGMEAGIGEETIREVRNRLSLPEDYLLYVGGYSHRKNVDMLLRAYGRARKRGLDLPLALAGGMESPYGRMIRAQVAAEGANSGVRLLGHVEGADLPALYAGARVFLYPSLYEGFGLPVLDAMACGAPVVCASGTSLVESGGDAALLLPPEEEKEWENAMVRLAGDAELRGALRRKGFAHAAGFRWERAARETMEVYARAVAGA